MLSECARPRAQQLPQARQAENMSHPCFGEHGCGRGRPHSVFGKHARVGSWLGLLSLSRFLQVTIQGGSVKWNHDDFAAVGVVAFLVILRHVEDREGEMGDMAVFSD